MNNLSKKFINEEGKEETVIATSNDNYKVKIEGKYKVVNHTAKKTNKIAEKFKNSLLGADIGVKSNGFSTIAILSTVIALAAVIALYFIWRF